jgi:hypothetical protein
MWCQTERAEEAWTCLKKFSVTANRGVWGKDSGMVRHRFFASSYAPYPYLKRTQTSTQTHQYHSTGFVVHSTTSFSNINTMCISRTHFLHCRVHVQQCQGECTVPTDHELIPARNATLAAMQGSASGSKVRYYPTWKHSSLKERNEQGCYNI